MRSRLLAAASALATAAGLALAACRAKEPAEQPPPAKEEMKVQETPVASIYDEKGGVLYERPARTPTVTPLPVPTPSPRKP